jgi:non-ribosomal peptide synthetase component F
MVRRYVITEHDRFSQTFDMTFDLSAFDMFVAWERGACVCCLPHKTLINPGRFIQDSRLTIWFSVPSVGTFMKRLDMLKPKMYPTLRWSLFCGEPLPAEVAEGWAEAAPQSVVENLYGPTELTIACTLYRWDREKSRRECEFGLVPIGEPYPGMEAIIVDDVMAEVPPGEEGELLMTGPQLSLGYWREAEKTAAAYVIPPSRNKVYYRTGDRVRKPVGNGPLVYLGRRDHQVKIQGHRVELGEVEAHLRREANVETAVALGWPITPSGAGGIVAFLGNTSLDTEAIRERLKAKLPGYAVPRQIHLLPELPLNANGKIDRRALLKILEAGS